MSEINKDMEGTTTEKETWRKRGGKKGSKRAPRAQVNFATATDNAIEYYNKYPTDYQAAFNFPWFKVMGTEIPFEDVVSGIPDASIFNIKNSRLPNTMVINYVPGPGICEDVQDPANRTFAMIMADLYAKTSGSSLGFNAAQVAMQMTSITSILNAIGEAQRALNSTEFWKTTNANYPRGLINALGFNWEDLVAYKANYVTRLNSIIHMFNNMQVPAFIDIYKRQFTLASNLYVDEDDEFGQVYAFRQKGIYNYVFSSGNKVQYCEFTEYSYNKDKFDTFLDLIQNALFKWVNSDDFYKVNGALLRAYKDAATITVPDVDLATVISPSKPDHILMQIMNCDILGEDLITGLKITENVVKNVIYFQPTFGRVADGYKATYPQLGHKRLIRLFDSNPTTDVNCESTRLLTKLGIVNKHIVNPDGSDITEQYYGVQSMQSELITSIDIYTIGDDYLTNERVVASRS
uniref:Capsid n=1 Tax=Macaque picobirnavirus 9 TaxID=2078825 RepID=A0A2L1FE63_9VIRU|nr:capsid [Macaque picobirnavirus 9]